MSVFAKPRILLATLFLGIVTIPSAKALPYYFEFGGTMATWTNPAAVLVSTGNATSSTVSSSFGVPMTFGLQLQDRPNGILFSIGVQNRPVMGQSGASESVTVMSTAPIFRIEFWKFVFGAGYSPWIFRDYTFKKAAGVTKALTLEGQLLFPITPEIDFGLSAVQTQFTTNADATSAGATKIMEYGAFFRLNFGFSGNAKEQRRKFKGWRYPFGSPLN